MGEPSRSRSARRARVDGHAAMKSYNAFALGADLRQRAQAVVAGAVTIGALSYGMEA